MSKKTVGIPDELWKQVKACAALDGKTINEWMSNLIEREMERRNK